MILDEAPDAGSVDRGRPEPAGNWRRPMRTALIAFAAFFISEAAVGAQIAPPDAKRAERINGLAIWMRNEGHDSQLPKDLALKLGLGEYDLPAKQKIYLNDQTNELYFVYLLKVNDAIRYVISLKSKMKSDIWNITESGAILVHLMWTPGGPRQSGDPNLDLYDQVVTVLEREMHRAGY
jgi:hypothetical protein